MASGRISRRALLGAAVVAGAAGAGGVARGAPANEFASVVARADRVRTPRHRRPGWTVGAIGRSGQGRPIRRWDSKPVDARRHVAVICGIHGDERGMAELADGFGRIDVPPDLHLTIVPHLNPDGWVAGTRRNGDGVDLNRNFPWGWRRDGVGGVGPASELETQAAMWFLGSERPDLTIWVHQPLGYVAALGGCPSHYADIWSHASSVPVRENLRQVGGGETWSTMALGLRSMLVEVAGTKAEPVGVPQHVEALEALLRVAEPS